MAKYLSPNLFADYKLHKRAYTQHCDRDVLLGRGQSDSSKRDSQQEDYFSTDFLPAMASDPSSMTYKLELLKNR